MRTMDVLSHFERRSPEVLATYGRLLAAARAFGPVTEAPKKTSIHLVRHAAFAGVVARRASLTLTLKSARDIRSRRITRHAQTSAHRWHLDVHLEKPSDVDRQIARLLALTEN